MCLKFWHVIGPAAVQHSSFDSDFDIPVTSTRFPFKSGMIGVVPDDIARNLGR